MAASKESEPRPEQNLKFVLENFTQEIEGFLKSPGEVSVSAEKAASLLGSLGKIFDREICRLSENYGLGKSLTERGKLKTHLNKEDLKKESDSFRDVSMSLGREELKLNIAYLSGSKYVLCFDKKRKYDSGILSFTFGEKRSRRVEFYNLSIREKGFKSNLIKATVYEYGKIAKEKRILIKNSILGHSIEQIFKVPGRFPQISTIKQ